MKGAGSRTAVITLLLGTGCAASMAGRAAGPFVDSSLDAIDVPENREHLGSVIGSPEVREGARVLASDMAGGAVEGLVDEAAVEEMVRRATRAASREFAASLRTELGPALRQVVREELRPEARAFLVEDIGPLLRGVATELAKGIAEGLAVTVRTGKGAVAPEDTLMSRARRLAQKGVWFLWLAAGALVLGLAMLVVLFVRKLRHPHKGTGVAPDLRPHVREALRELLADPIARRALAEELQRHEDRPTTH